MRTLFKCGTVITGRGPKRADVLVEGEKVRQVGRLILTPADRTVDVEGCLLFPGFIDAHTHFDLDVCNTTTADDFTTGSRAALKGGTTTVIDFACPNKGRACTTAGAVAPEGRRPHLLRLRLPHDHRRLERRHPRRAAADV